jgi:2-keto-4-pentenoate hydratase
VDRFERKAAELRNAYQRGAIEPMRDVLESNDAVGAYAIQSINTRHWMAAGRKIVGRKIGLTSRSVQAQLGVDQPDYGVLFEDMQIPDGGVLEKAKVLQPKAEAEIAFVLARDLPVASTPDQVAAAIAYAAAAIEIVDSRIANWSITFADTVADNGSSAFFVLGPDRLQVEGLDLFSCGMVLEVNGMVQSLGAGAACLGHPFNAAVWLASILADLGEPLRAGDIIMSGALGPMVALQPGDKVRATIGGLGSVAFRFEGDGQ